MVKLIMGLKGSGKTKRLVDLVREAVAMENGDVVCIEKEMKRQGIERRAAEKYVHSNDKFRREYYKYHTGREWENPYNYDLCLNTGKLTYDQCVEVIKNYLHTRID